MSAPERLNVWSLFESGDFPSDMATSTGAWYVGTRTIVRPDGTIQSCEVEFPSQSRELDVLTCSIILKRAKFAAARGPDGSHIYAADRVTIAWTMDAPAELPFDVTLDVKSLPDSRSQTATVPVMFLTDPAGGISSCGADRRKPPYVGLEYDFSPSLVAVACQQVGSAIKVRPVKNDAGVSIPAVQNAIIQFQVKN